MRQHVPVLGWCFIVYHTLAALVGLFVGAAITGVGAITGEREIMFLTGTIGMGIAAFLIVLGAFGVVAGIGLLKFRPWARILAIIVAALKILHFPFGTALGVYALVVLLHSETAALFEQQQPSAVL
jgi:hypothetical protein